MRKHAVESITTACLFWLPIDLLYLYYAGAWCEPIKTVEIVELVVLYLLPVFAVWRYIQYIKQARKVGNG